VVTTGDGQAALPRWAASLRRDVEDRIGGAIGQAGQLPVLDATVRQLLTLLDDPNSSTAEAVALIEQDPEFAAQLLRLANSAYYARRSTWKTVRQALAAVGRAAAARLCLESATFRFLERAPGNGSASRGQLHVHAVSVAMLAAETARRAEIEIESAHLAGLLHDFGKLVMPLAFGEEPLDELARAHPYGIERATAEWERFGIDHAHAGALYTRDCGLDAEVCTAIAYHHGGRSGVRVPSRLAAAVQIAEMLAGVLNGAAPDWTLIEEAMPQLGLDLAALEEIALSVGGGQSAARQLSGTAERVAELERLAHTDDLTGVASRRAWIDHARDHLAAAHPGTLLLCDVDGLKLVNDTHGHAAGDALLTQLGAILAQYGFAGRLGGDEFAVWLEQPTQSSREATEKIIERTAQAFSWAEIDGQAAGVSIGVASAPGDATDLATLLEVADRALYELKRAGGSRRPPARRAPARPRKREPNP
jgi:diguanylate cyclase (GGDEF)-like protein/putative nucleotidyltransferase with HDIG domain